MSEDFKKQNDGHFSSELEGNVGFTEEEKLEIQAEINNIIRSSKIAITQDRLRPNAQRSGLRFPLIINSILFGALAVVITVFAMLFSNEQQQRIAEAQTFISTESQLIKELVRQSEQQLADREAQIESIQGELAQISEALASLEEDITLQVESRRNDLEEAFDREVETRKQQLESENYTSEEVEQLLDNLREESQQRINNELAELEAELEVQSVAREAELTSLRSTLEGEISSRQDQINQLQTSLQQTEKERLAALRSGEQTIADLEEQIASVSGLETEYQALLSQQETSSTIAAQIDSAFQESFRYLNQDLFDQSAQELNKIETLVSRLAVSGYNRTELDLQTIQILRAFIALKQTSREQLEGFLDLNGENSEVASILPQAERYTTLQEDFRAALNRSQGISDPNQAKQVLLSVFNDYQIEFPNFTRIINQYDSAIIGVVETENEEAVEALATQSNRQVQQASDQGRDQGVKDAYDTVRAALGNTQLANRARVLQQEDRTLSTIYNLIQNAIDEEVANALEQADEENAAQVASTAVSVPSLPFIGYVTSSQGSSEFTFSNAAGIAVRLGTEVLIYRESSGTYVQIGRAVVSRTDNNIIQAVIREVDVREIQRKDSVYLSR